MKKEINNKKEAKEKLKKHLKNMAINKNPYAVETANNKIQPTQKPRG